MATKKRPAKSPAVKRVSITALKADHAKEIAELHRAGKAAHERIGNLETCLRDTRAQLYAPVGVESVLVRDGASRVFLTNGQELKGAELEIAFQSSATLRIKYMTARKLKEGDEPQGANVCTMVEVGNHIDLHGGHVSQQDANAIAGKLSNALKQA